MKRLLRTALCLALGAASLSASARNASAQELNFRAVVPPRPAAVSAEIPITLTQPTAIDARPAIARAKVQDDGTVVFTSYAESTSMPPAVQPARFAQQGLPRQMPQGAPGEFIAPPPKIIADPQNPGMVVNPPPGVVVNPPPGTIVNGPGVVGGPAPYSVLNGAVVDSGCCGDSCGTSCCGTSCGNGCCWEDGHPFDRIHDFFACGCGNGCCAPRTPLWIRGEYLLYTVTRQGLPALVTQAPTANQLALDSGASTLLYGNTGVPSTFMNGGRISGGFWFPNHCDWGVDGSYMFLGLRNDRYSTSSNGVPAIGRPFVDNTPLIVRDVLGNGATALIANPGVGLGNAEIVAGNGTPGSITINSNTQFSSFDVNLRRKLCCGQNFWLDGLIGYRYANLEDGVDIVEDIGPRTNLGSTASRTIVHDGFATRNVFNGAQVGLDAEFRFCNRWTLGGTFKIAGGNVNQRVSINGDTTLFNARFPSGDTFARQTQSGGLLAQTSNIGTYSSDRFAIMPELGIRLGWDITNHWRVFAAYNVLYMSNVVRAGEQIDNRVNYSQAAFSGYTPANAPAGTRVVLNGSHGTLLPGSPAVPSVLFRTNEFWAQGVSFGFEYRY